MARRRQSGDGRPRHRHGRLPRGRRQDLPGRRSRRARPAPRPRSGAPVGQLHASPRSRPRSTSAMPAIAAAPRRRWRWPRTPCTSTPPTCRSPTRSPASWRSSTRASGEEPRSGSAPHSSRLARDASDRARFVSRVAGLRGPSPKSNACGCSAGRQLGERRRIEAEHVGQILDLGQIGQVVEAELVEELAGRAVHERPADDRLAADHLHQLAADQRVEHARRVDAADLGDLGRRHRLAVGDDRQRLERRHRQLLRRALVEQAPHVLVQLGPRDDLVAAGDFDQLQARPGRS